MKNLEPLVTSDAIHDHLAKLWRTDLFRLSHRAPGGYVAGWVAAYAAQPRVFCEATDPPLERAHFLAWMGVTPYRHEYDNDAISDLYYFHEIVHQATMPYERDLPFERFCTKVWDNERLASLESEVFVYFELPGLREQTFGFEIWADRFLNSASWRDLFVANPSELRSRIDLERQRAMVRPKANDASELLIAKYASLNEAWARIWKENYLEVENAMAAFVEASGNNREAALKQLITHLETKQGSNATPYLAEAQAFAEAVKRLYASD